MTLPPVICSICGRRYEVDTLAWRCECGGVLDIDWTPTGLDVSPEQQTRGSLWRYESVLPIAYDERLSMGEGASALVWSRTAPQVRLKLDFLSPTLSFKDRGAVLLATLAAQLGVTSAMVDSSGNAGTAAAAYFARAGIACRVLVPAATSPGKLAQIRAHGADVTLIEGSRADTAAAAMSLAATPGTFYASHVFNPYFLHGVKTYGYEIWEQSGRSLPPTVVVPVGNGTLVLGCYLAFRELVATGLADRMPAVVAVQAEGCAPVEAAFAGRRDNVTAVVPAPTVAEGIAISDPPRGAAILAAVRDTGGAVIAVTDDEVRLARAELAREGLYVEPTSAVCWAAVHAAARDVGDRGWNWALAGELIRRPGVVVPLCGAGLKAPG